MRGAIFAALGKSAEAIDDFSQGIRLGGEGPRVYVRRAGAYEAQGLKALALADYRKATELDALSPLQREARVLARERIAVLEATGATAPQAAAKPLAKPFDPGKRVALVIGVSAYDSVARLKNPNNDARAMAKALRSLNFAEVVELYDPKRAAVEAALKSFSDKASAADWAMVFFAGHGMQMDGRNYLIPSDAELKHLRHVKHETVSLDDMLDSLSEAKKLRLVILDACRNNPFLNRLIESGGGQRALGRGFAPIEPKSGMLVAFATRDGDVAADGEGDNSPFTLGMLAHIEEPGVDIGLFFRKVRDRVMAATSNKQEPFTYGSLPSEELYFKGPN